MTTEPHAEAATLAIGDRVTDGEEVGTVVALNASGLNVSVVWDGLPGRRYLLPAEDLVVAPSGRSEP